MRGFSLHLFIAFLVMIGVVWGGGILRHGIPTEFGPSRAAADVLQGVSLADLEKALDEAGVSELTSGEDKGNFFVGGVVDGLKVMATLRDCPTEGSKSRCGLVGLYANFNTGRALELADFRRLNQFNENLVMGRAYGLEDVQTIGVDYNILVKGGVTSDWLEVQVATWRTILTLFIQHMNETGGTS